MQIETRFNYDKIKHNQENEVSLVITLKAPKVDWQGKRSPICVIPVVDVSGSMSGDKMRYAKLSVLKLVEHLKPGDFCGLATFTDAPELVAAPMEVTQSKKEELKSKIGGLEAQRSTNFSGGMLMGLEQLNKGDLPDGMILRAIMFTDGLANCGIATTRDQLLPLLEKELGKGTLSAFGYGTDADQDLLGDLAKKGKGNYAYIKNPDDALTAFARELGGLLSVHAQDIELNLEANNGHKFEKVVSDVDVEEKDGKLKIKLPSLLGEETRHIVVKMKLSEQTQALPRQVNVAELKVSATVIEEGARKPFSEELKAKIQFVKPGEEQEKPTPEVDKLVALAEVIEAQVESEKLAAAGNYQAAHAHMTNIGEELHARGHTAMSANAMKLGGMVGSAQTYGSSGGYRGTSKGIGVRGMSLGMGDAEAVADWQGMAGQMTNESQGALVQSFTGGGAVNPPAAVPFVSPVPPVQPSIQQSEKKSASKKKSSRW